MRKCKKCKKELNNRGKNILKDVCRKCYINEYYIRNRIQLIEDAKKRHKEQSYESKKEYFERNPDKKKKLHIRQMTYQKHGKAKICSACGSKERVQHHHFEPYQVDIFIELCSTCHSKYFHRKYGKEELPIHLKPLIQKQEMGERLI